MKIETLLDIINSNPAPTPWSEGDNIPWNEPSFSERMLKEHLAQEHDAASRRSEKIEQHIVWIHEEANLGQAGRLLDLGCGPGLYASQLAQLGYQVTGIDYSPASIAYAQAQAAQHGQKIRYILGDIRQAEYAADDGGTYDCAMQVYGESNVFRPLDLRKILLKIHTVLRSGGLLILEVHTYDVIQKNGQAPSSWYAAESGLFFPNPHLVLTQHFWDEQTNTATIRHFVVEAATGNVIRYAQSMQAYTNNEYISLLMESGFDEIEFIPSMSGIPDPDQEGLFVITAKKTE